MKKIILKIYKNTIGKINYLRIKNKDITIISNNCWGGIFYRNNNLEYLSPTLGMFFIGKEYIKFIYNLKHYIECELNFIKVENSKYYDYLKKIQYNGIIGVLEDVEICFLHYENEKEALEKWNRRKKRINYNNILYKFNDQNLCTYHDLKMFENFEAKNKILFTAKKYDNINSIQIKKYKNYEYVLEDIKSYKKYVNIYKFLNKNMNKEK